MATPPNANQITAPRVPLLDPRTGSITREWYLFFYNLYVLTGNGTGITPVTGGGTGLATVPTNGQLLIGNGTGYTLNTLTASTGITIANGAGAISIANAGVLTFSAGGTGLTPSIGTAGNVVLNGTLIPANGGTGQTTYTNGQLLIGNTTGGTLAKATLTAGSGITITNGSGAITVTATGSGTVTSVAATVPSFLSVTGSPITTSGTIAISYSGLALPIANGGTGATTAATALTALGAYAASNPSGFTSTQYATISNDTTTNAVRYPLFADATSGNLTASYASSTKLNFNPSTGALTVSQLIIAP